MQRLYLQFLAAKERMGVSTRFGSGLAKEKSKVSVLARKLSGLLPQQGHEKFLIESDVANV